MKTLQESLFDKDIVKNSDVKLGELYDLSDRWGYNMLSNDTRKVLAMFDEKLWRKEKFSIEVSSDHGPISAWSRSHEDPRLKPFVNMLLNTPLEEINNLFEDPTNGYKVLAKYLSKYFSYHGGKARKMYISGRKLNGDDFIEIKVYDDIMLDTPSSIQLTFEKR